VVVVPSPIPDRSLPWADVVTEHVRVLRDLGTIAGEFDVRLSFEFLGFGWCSVRTPRAAYEIVRATDRPNVGMTVDAAHFYGGGGLLDELDALDPVRIFAFHLDDLEDTPKEAITDATRVLPGRGVVPLDAICARLKAIGYDGPCSIELFRPEYWEWDPYDLASKARTAAVRVLASQFRVE
jgi:2-keto-myo-inositol isomerase